MSFDDDARDLDQPPATTTIGALLQELAATATTLAEQVERGTTLGPGDGFGLDMQVHRIRFLIGEELLRHLPASTPVSDQQAQVVMAATHNERADQKGAA